MTEPAEKIQEEARNLIEEMWDREYSEEEEEKFFQQVKNTLKKWEQHKKNMEAEMIDEKEIYTPDEIAEYLKLAPNTIRRHLKGGTLKGFKIGTHWRVKREDLINFIEQGMNQ